MAFSFKTPAGQTIDRALLVLYMNVGTESAPEWAPIGKRVEDSSMEMDWATNTKQDILGGAYTTGKKAVRTQTFDPCELDAGDAAQQKIWQLAIVEDNVNALLNQDLLLVHLYSVNEENAAFAERFPSSAVLPSGLGGEGGGAIGMPIDVTFGGVRAVGTATVSGSTVTFTPAAE